MVARLAIESSLLDRTFSSHEACFQPVLSWLLAVIQTVDCRQFEVGRPSSQLKKLVEVEFQNMDWNNRVLINRQFETPLSTANYIVDFQKIFSTSECNNRHQVAVEFALDNRQAVGTNLLKANYANQFFSTNADSVSLAVLITLSKSSRISGGWDSATSLFDDYSLAIRQPYAGVFNSTILLLSL